MTGDLSWAAEVWEQAAPMAVSAAGALWPAVTQLGLLHVGGVLALQGSAPEGLQESLFTENLAQAMGQSKCRWGPLRDPG